MNFRNAITFQIRHVARLLAAQMTAAKIGPGFEASKFVQQKPTPMDEDFDDDYDDDDAASNTTKISTLVGGTLSSDVDLKMPKKSNISKGELL